MTDPHPQLTTLLAASPFVPFSIKTSDGRVILVRSRDAAVLNSLAISVVEAPFSVTVISLAQITAVEAGSVG